jgi:GT2 family glycosyltransferase
VEQCGWTERTRECANPSRIVCASPAEVGQAQGEYTVVVPSNVQLSAHAADFWNEFLKGTNCDAAYSDWDHVDAIGHRHTPRFTPEFSPELLRRTAYWGDCFLVRTSLLKEINQDADPAHSVWAHALAQRIAESTKAVVRIPRILWHCTSAPGAIEAVGGRQSGDPAQASIVICTRTPRLLGKCLRALRRSDAAQAEIVVVAHDFPAAQIASAHGARAVSYSGQFHYGLMNALGARHSTRPAVVFLNDDVAPIAPGWLSALLGPLRSNDVGITGGLLLYPNGSVQHAGISVGGRPVPSHVGRHQTSSLWWPWLRSTREVSAVTGACLAIRRNVWDELEGFDRRFPVNYNDVDLCLRARRAGYSVILESAALLCHREAQTRSTLVAAAERALFTSLWTPELAAADPFFNPNLALPDERIVLANPLYT